MSRPPIDELVICTRDRPIDLARCLASVAVQSLENFSLTIVDGGERAPAREVVDAFTRKCRQGIAVHYYATTPGLTRQRNFALSRLQPTVRFVHFIDDDTVLDDQYLSEIRRVFEDDHEGSIGGVGGTVQNMPRGSGRRLEFALGLDHPTGGLVLKSGINVLLYRPEVLTDVEWLSGCAMSYRREAFDRRWFDGSMEGYSLGEDVEFSFGLHFRMRLAITPTAKIWHYQSQVNRIGARRRAHDGVLFRFAQLRGHPSHFSGSAVLIGAASSVVLDGAAGLLGRRPGRMASAIGTMAGLWRLASDREARRARLGTAQPHRADRASERA